MSEQLSAFRIKQGRRVFDSFSGINSFSFALVTGNTITLYAMLLGANSTVIGLLGAFMFLSFFSIPLGRSGLKRRGLVKTFAHNWMLRNFSLLPLLFIPLLYARGALDIAIALMILSVFFFNFFRGVGLISNNPVIGILSTGKDRGEYIVWLSLVNNATALVATLFLAFLLWNGSGVETYHVVTITGIITGTVASLLLYRLPDSGMTSFDTTERQFSLQDSLQLAWTTPNIRTFMLSYLMITLGIGMARPFIIVYSKAVYGQSDSVLTLFTVCSILGALLMGLVLRLVIDRLGSKPMYIIFSLVIPASLLFAVAAPGIGTISFSLIFLALLSAATNIGFAGQESAAQAYFFAAIPRNRIVDMSMLYFFILGGTGAAGAVLGGAFLDVLAGTDLATVTAYRLFFSLCAVLAACGILIQRRLQDLGSFPVRDSLAVLFSPRDMRALTLLRKLDTTRDPDKETRLITELGTMGSPISVEKLLDHLSSPRFAIRYEALQSVGRLRRLSPRITETLLDELSHGEFSTAALAARLLGMFRVRSAAGPLREALNSPDYRLVAEAMLALARIGDERAQFLAGEILLSSNNPFVLVHGVQAMEIWHTTAAVPILLDLLRNDQLPPHVADETILTLSVLMGVPRRFFYRYEEYTRERERIRVFLHEEIDEVFTRKKRQDPEFQTIVMNFLMDQNADEPFVRWVLDTRRGKTGIFSALLVSVALDAELNRLEPFRFFLCFWAVSVYANPRMIEM
ncbi:MAG TPA: MFS transporter [Treponemataceae bacterium]|nr:MFS transporter [Treponemataceae bacterium]